MSKKVNIAVQLIPITDPENMYQVIDKAIETIKSSGVRYTVCPFETVMQGTYEELMHVIEKMQRTCFKAGAQELIMNLKIHMADDYDILIEDKVAKYNN